MNEKLEKVKETLNGFTKMLIDAWNTFVSAMKAAGKVLIDTWDSFIRYSDEHWSLPKAAPSKPFNELWIYPPIVESEIKPFVFDEQCEKCHMKGTHPRRYVAKVSLLLTSCRWCGATWWQRPADYASVEQLRNKPVKLTAEDLDIPKFDSIDALRYNLHLREIFKEMHEDDGNA